MWIIIKFYNIIIKSANMDKGGGDQNAYPQNVDVYFFLLNPSLRSRDWDSGKIKRFLINIHWK